MRKTNKPPFYLFKTTVSVTNEIIRKTGLKAKSVMCLLIITTGFINAQTMKESGDTKLYLVTDIKTTTSASNSSNNTGTGKLGVTFKSGYFYGSVLFNVVNRTSTSNDSTQKEEFINNLLIPDNSGQGLSNFYISMGIKSFAKYNQEYDWSNEPLLSFKRIGAYGFWQVNNTIWNKDSISIPIYLSSLGIFFTYNILSLQLLGEDNEKVYLSWFGGVENRIIGGDYSLADNKMYRKKFLGTDNLRFVSFPTVGFKLEIGKFYGKITETNFGNNNIAGFSNWQALITVGVNVDLNIAAKKSDPTK